MFMAPSIQALPLGQHSDQLYVFGKYNLIHPDHYFQIHANSYLHYDDQRTITVK